MGRDGKKRRERKHTRREVSEVFGVHVNTVANWLQAGKLKGLTLADIIEFSQRRGK